MRETLEGHDGEDEDRGRWGARLAQLGLAPDPDERDRIARARAGKEPGLERLRRLDAAIEVEHAAIDRGR